jgi:Protein of unknown function (DUF1592)/Protein of unknown function (DUF1588)/Protein of unknown function (DUF1595)/Protein of unknown function (DUF1585)/Protein of unknown function (DUF1587)
MKDLLQSPTSLNLTARFVNDATSTLFSNNGGELQVAGDLWTDYQTAGEEVARLATLNAAALQKVCGGTAPNDGPQMISLAGQRVFRRPLTASEISRYSTLYGQGATLFPSMTAPLAGARVVMEAMLQSPHFLYRPESSTQVSNGVVPLNSYELASRLSYALWQSMPDAELFASAKSNALLDASSFQAQVKRLALSSKAKSTVADFHAQLLSAKSFADVSRDPILFPEFSVALRTSMAEEQRRFVEEVVFTNQGKFANLLTDNFTFVDANLAKVYKLQGTFDANYVKHTFTDGKRAGLLSQIGFLSVNASASDSDPIHRGVFVNRRLLCSDLAAPPIVIPPVPPSPPGAPKTLRARISEHTGKGTCGQGCHSTLINPIGFSFEHYDALGRYRETDRNGLTLDSKDSFTFDSNGATPFNDGIEFSKLMSTQNQVHACYAQHLVEFFHGRATETGDAALIANVAHRSQNQGLPVLEVIQSVVSSESFTARLP